MTGDSLCSFWRLLDEKILEEEWGEAIRLSLGAFSGLPVAKSLELHMEGVVAEILGEGQFGAGHWQLSLPKRIYYRLVRPLLPGFLHTPLRTRLLSRQRKGFMLEWPVEERYARFLFQSAAYVLESKGLESIPYIRFWPGGKDFALVLTHDVEGRLGQSFVRQVMALEEAYGFRSSFNFVPEGYPVELELLQELRERGFEVGVHGLKHDGSLFSSEEAFKRQAVRINRYLKEWGAVGFRSPFTHRNPAWMQALEIEYDSSFFDSDPYEPLPGGTMSLWPFTMGHFVELPYTLAQDHTLMVTLGETTPRLWLEKVEFIHRYHGMALLNSHPDYLREPPYFEIYEAFLKSLGGRSDYWHALPKDVARWWRRRAAARLRGGRVEAASPEEADFEFSLGVIRRAQEGGIVI